MAEEKKEDKQERWQLADVPTQHETMVVDGTTQEAHTIPGVLVKILNKLERIENSTCN